MNEHVCSDWDDFKAKLLKDHFDPATRKLYRGQSNSCWKLVSPWDRVREKNPRLGPSDVLPYLDRFKNLAIGTRGLQTQMWSDVEWWSVGRHHGLVTPLLDWSRSPFVAAYFAFIGYANSRNPGFQSGYVLEPYAADEAERVAVWALDRSVANDQACELEVVYARGEEAYRQRAQVGAFTILRSSAHTALEYYLEACGKGGFVRKYTIPAKYYTRALGELRLMNITEATLFPDLDGAAVQANVDDLVHRFLT
jgi:hypothetical protein